MEEKKLTDEEIIKALDICYNDVHCSIDCPYFNLNGRNFCQDKELYKDLKRIVLEHSNQKAEIERLKENLANEKKWGKIQTKQTVKETAEKFAKRLKAHLKESYHNLYHADYREGMVYMNLGTLFENIDEIANEITGYKMGNKCWNCARLDKVTLENTELQKQVDELKDICLDCPYKLKFDEIEKQTVKETAKEIYQEIDKSDILVVETQEYGEIEVVPIERLKEIIKSKGVEVE